MDRERLVTALLVILGVALAIGLFVAGALWKARVSPEPSTLPGHVHASGQARTTVVAVRF